jgi:Arc/MetJ family transcription regulator
MREQRKKRMLAITVDKCIFDEVERRRGLVKRSSYVNEMLRRFLHDDTDGLVVKASATIGKSSDFHEPNQAVRRQVDDGVT